MTYVVSHRPPDGYYSIVQRGREWGELLVGWPDWAGGIYRDAQMRSVEWTNLNGHQWKIEVER
jgi:hypothetical protein